MLSAVERVYLSRYFNAWREHVQEESAVEVRAYQTQAKIQRWMMRRVFAAWREQHSASFERWVMAIEHHNESWKRYVAGWARTLLLGYPKSG